MALQTARVGASETTPVPPVVAGNAVDRKEDAAGIRRPLPAANTPSAPIDETSSADASNTQTSDGGTQEAVVLASARYTGSTLFQIPSNSSTNKRISAKMATCKLMCCVTTDTSDSPHGQAVPIDTAGRDENRGHRGRAPFSTARTNSKGASSTRSIRIAVSLTIRMLWL